jgi:hypothetical protein
MMNHRKTRQNRANTPKESPQYGQILAFFRVFFGFSALLWRQPGKTVYY